MLRVCLGLVTILLIGIITMRAILFPNYQQRVVPCSPEEGTTFIEVTENHLARFQEAIKLQTISYSIHESNTTALSQLLDHIAKSYPTIHTSPLVTLERFNYSSLYIIQGTDQSLKPVLLSGHIDVVPAVYSKWSFHPFAGAVDNEIIYGRGTLDTKNTVFGILEALEHFLRAGKQPKRHIYIAIGHDEEVMGLYGAKAITKELKNRGVRFAFMMDEGCPVLKDGNFPGYSGPVGLICTAEKGYATLRLSIEHPGGHASAPPPNGGAISILSNAIVQLQNNPMPNLFGQGIEVAMMEHAAVSQSWLFRILSSNLWIFSPLVSFAMSRKDATRAQITSTFAFTQIHGGVKDNVLPNSASVTVNSRILPGHTMDDIVNHVKKVINNPNIKLEVIYFNEASAISSTSSEGYNVIHHTIKQIFPNAIVVPGLMIGGSDTKHYGELCDNVYRFVPTFLSPEEKQRRFHGHDELITVKNFEQTINFFHHLLENLEKSFEVKLRDEL